ncbi:MAG: hypothetical protein H6754_04600 [Candidatus Omnitrophica bacterium]|nr:hypothetical protein [Candidatus Omnitrophota bacterium]
MRILKVFVPLFFLMLVASPIWACSMCFKDPNASMTSGLKQAMFILLIALFTVFAAFLKFIWSFRKRSHMFNGSKEL